MKGITEKTQTQVNWIQPGSSRMPFFNLPTAGNSLKQQGKAAEKNQGVE